jgi:hypothetical protein
MVSTHKVAGSNPAGGSNFMNRHSRVHTVIQRKRHRDRWLDILEAREKVRVYLLNGTDYTKHYYTKNREVTREEFIKIEASRRVDTRTTCSCYLCGNPRKYFHEKHLNERRQDEADRVDKWGYEE